MASSAIHLAIAKKYMEKNKVKNPEKFLAGTLYPDACEDNDKSYKRKNKSISIFRKS